MCNWSDDFIAHYALRITNYALPSAADLAKLRALDSEISLTVDNRIKGTVVKLPRYVRTSGDAIVEVFAGDGKAFVYLPQLEAAGVNVASIPKSKRYVAKSYPSAFVIDFDLLEILTASANEKLLSWWTTCGRAEVRIIIDEFLSAQDLLRKCLEVELPDDWPKLTAAGDALVKMWTPKLERLPVCFLRRIIGAIHRLETSRQERNFATAVSEKCLSIIDERPAPVNKMPAVVKMSGTAQKVSQVQTPDDKTLEFFAVKGCGKIFVHGAQLAVACGYPNQAGTTADKTDFSKAVTAVAKFYAVRRNETDTKARRFVAVEDVPAVLQEFSFNRTNKPERYETTVELLRWWLDERPPLDKPTEFATRTDEFTPLDKPTELARRTDERPPLDKPTELARRTDERPPLDKPTELATRTDEFTPLDKPTELATQTDEFTPLDKPTELATQTDEFTPLDKPTELATQTDEFTPLDKPTELATRTDEFTPLDKPTELATRTDERPPLDKNVDILEVINARADSLMKNFGALRRDALRAAVKLTAQDTGRDLSPLLELLD